MTRAHKPIAPVPIIPVTTQAVTIFRALKFGALGTPIRNTPTVLWWDAQGQPRSWWP